jgi:hypothetical protein
MRLKLCTYPLLLRNFSNRQPDAVLHFSMYFFTGLFLSSRFYFYVSRYGLGGRGDGMHLPKVPDVTISA